MASNSTMLITSDIVNRDILKTLKDKDVIPFLKDAVSKELAKEEEVEQNKLKIQANKFLSAVEQINAQSVSKLRQALKNPSVVSSSQIDSLRDDMIKDQAKYFLAMNFEEYLDRFRGIQQQRKMIYVETSEDNTTIIGSYEFTIKELIYSSKSGKFENFNKMMEIL